jgi:hypothetical protein
VRAADGLAPIREMDSNMSSPPFSMATVDVVPILQSGGSGNLVSGHNNHSPIPGRSKTPSSVNANRGDVRSVSNVRDERQGRFARLVSRFTSFGMALHSKESIPKQQRQHHQQQAQQELQQQQQPQQQPQANTTGHRRGSKTMFLSFTQSLGVWFSSSPSGNGNTAPVVPIAV